MFYFNWSSSEKKVARRAFDVALTAELAEIMAEFKARAAAAAEPADMWEVERYLRASRIDIDQKYIYRYSRLPDLFAWLLREGRIQEEHLLGLAEEKLALIRRWATIVYDE